MIDEKEFYKSVGKKLRHFRDTQNIKQVEAAEKLGIFQSQLSRMESGVHSLSLYNLYVLMDEYDINPMFFFRPDEKLIDTSKRKARLVDEVERLKTIIQQNGLKY